MVEQYSKTRWKLTKYEQLLAIILLHVHCHKSDTGYILKDCEKDCHLK